MSILEQLSAATKVTAAARENANKELEKIDAEIEALTNEVNALELTPMTKNDYMQLYLDDVDARHKKVAASMSGNVINTFFVGPAESLRLTPAPPTVRGTEFFPRNAGNNGYTERLFAPQNPGLDAWCYLSPESVKRAIKSTFESIEWPFDSVIDSTEASHYVKTGKITPNVKAKPLAEIRKKIADAKARIAELHERRDELFEELSKLSA